MFFCSVTNVYKDLTQSTQSHYFFRNFLAFRSSCIGHGQRVTTVNSHTSSLLFQNYVCSVYMRILSKIESLVHRDSLARYLFYLIKMSNIGNQRNA